MLIRSLKIDATKVTHKKKRTHGVEEFYRDAHNSMLENNDDIDADFNDLVDATVASMPWHRTTHGTLLHVDRKSCDMNIIIIILTRVNHFFN